jgi:hypothetical protein
VVAAALSPAPVCSRRVSAGVRPEPGATSARPAWWGATDWVEVEVRGAVGEHRDICRAHHVDPDTVIAIARDMAHFADHRTGRDCRPTNTRLVTLLRVSLSTVQRARRVLKQLGLVVELVRGRSVMTRAERLTAWRRGSAHRHVAAEFALCSRRSRPGRSWSLPQLVERDTPPSALRDNGYLTPLGSSLRTKTETKKAAPRPAAAQNPAASRRRGVDPRTQRLAEAVRRRLGWLSEVSTRRLAPALHRFAQASWTPRDVDRAVVDALATRGWRLPRRLDQPAAYLATLLRALDPEDRPGALDEHIAAVEAAQRTYERQLVTGSPCPHGQPAGDVPSPLRGHRACPLCRLGGL